MKVRSRWSVLLLALAACSSADTAELDANGASTGLTSGYGEDSDEGDGDTEQTGTGEDAPTLDLGGSTMASCDPWAQDCPAGEKCSWEWVADVAKTRCVPVEPDAKLPGEPCEVFGDPSSGYDDCALGAVCSYLDADNLGVCVGLCGGSPAEPSCAVEQAVCHVCPDCPSLCKPVCDPLAEDCPAGFACTPDAGSLSCQPSDGLGTGTLGDTCEYAFQCAAGHACVAATQLSTCEGAGCCSPFCDLVDPSCPDALVCTPWFPDDDAAPLPNLGVCGSP